MNKKQLLQLIENNMPDDAYVAFDMWYASDIMNNFNCPEDVAKSFIDHLHLNVMNQDIDEEFDMWLWSIEGLWSSEDAEQLQKIIKFRNDRLED